VVQITVTAASSPAIPQAPTASLSLAQTTMNGDAGTGGALLAGVANVQNNFALSQTDDAQAVGGLHWAEHAQFAQLVSVLASRAQQLTDMTDAHFVFDNVSEMAQHHVGDYHLI
jgi:serralysin